MDKYHVLELIGEGSFGKVYKGRKKFTGQIVALKMIPKAGKAEKELRSLRREIEIMRGLHHENIIEMCDSYETGNEVVVVTDYAEGELFQILEDDGNLPKEQVQSIACHLVSALYYLHSHRILHRDMKPQNILLGKGGIVKLCDFGFARAMSMNTLVLTSIKGTPLYMAPELVEEKPYDHTADLWALGCILYELYTGTPPYYTNSIFQLVNMIIKDPVKWPKTMDPVFKDFLQGLLTKPPKSRLSWPELLHHPFVADGVKFSEEDAKLDSPFTQPLTASLMLKKEEQAKKKAHPPGTSKILAKARKKAMEEVAKKKPGLDKKTIEKACAEAWGPSDKKEKSGEISRASQPERPHTGQWDVSQQRMDNLVVEEFDPTPRADRISKDYQKEYPSIEIEGRRTIKKSPDNKKKNFENVKLDTEEIDSDDEWQGLIDVTDQENDPDQALILLQDDKFIHKLKNRLNSSCVQVHDGMLVGAARLRTALRVITNLVTLKCDVDLILCFCKAVSLPVIALQTLSEILEKSKVKQQPWCQQILIDLVIALNAYFASEISWCDRLEKHVVKDFLDCAIKFLELVPKLLTQHIDGDLRLKEQTLLCVKYLSEVMERNKMNIANDYYSTVVKKESSSLESIISSANHNPDVLKALTDYVDGNLDEAAQRQEILRNLSVDCLSSMIFIPIDVNEGIDGKRKVAQYVGNKLATKGYERQTDELLLLLRHPDHACPVLKVVYGCCQVSPEFCAYISSQPCHIESLLGLLMGKVDIPDMEVNSAIETVLNIFSAIVILLQTLPPTMTDTAGLLVSIFLESTIASHTAAAALLFSQMVYCGVFIEVQPEEMLQACLSVFTDLAQICVRCPFEYGILDGLLLLLCELLKQSEIPIAQLYIECGIWGNLWHRVAQALQVINPETNQPIHFIEHVEGDRKFHPPDFALVSPQGVMAIVQMSVMVFTKETYQCIPNLAAPDSVVMLTLTHLLNKNFLEEVARCVRTEDDQLIVDLIQEITQLFCFPFAVDTSPELLQEVQHCLYTAKLLPRLLHSCVNYIDVTELETPLSLMSRLVMASSIFVEQFATAVQDEVKATPFLVKALDVSSPLEVICDTLTICSHLVRISPQHVSLVNSVCHGSKGDYENLSSLIMHNSTAIKSRTCSLLGNLMKHDGKLYTLFKKKDKLFQGLIACLTDEDPNVRKSASYAVGNAGYHSDELYVKLKMAVSPLVSLLQDPVTKTRANAASACGNLGMHSSLLCTELKKHKIIPILLDTACHDLQTSVQISAVLALRSLSQQADLKKEMITFKAVEKLSHVKVGDTPRAASVTPRPHSGMSVNVPITSRPQSSNIASHCNKLIRVLQG